MGSRSFIYMPQNMNKNQCTTDNNFDWEDEYSRAMDQIRLHFEIKDENRNIALSVDNDEKDSLPTHSQFIDNAKHFGMLFNSLTQNEATQFAVVIVTATVIVNKEKNRSTYQDQVRQQNKTTK